MSHLCAVSMEYELFSASKLPVSYKAAVMKRVNEIKKLTGQRELHVAVIPHTADEHVDDIVEHISASHTLSSSEANHSSSFSDVSPVDITTDNGAVNVVSYTYCDKDDISLSSPVSKSKPSTESVDNCDVKSYNGHEVRGNIESSSVCEIVTSDRNRDFVEHGDCRKDDPSNRCKTRNDVIHSHDVDLSSQALVKSESMLAVDATNNATSGALKIKKSVRISDSPPTVSCVNRRPNEVCNGASSSILKVSQLSALP